MEDFPQSSLAASETTVVEPVTLCFFVRYSMTVQVSIMLRVPLLSDQKWLQFWLLLYWKSETTRRLVALASRGVFVLQQSFWLFHQQEWLCTMSTCLSADIAPNHPTYRVPCCCLRCRPCRWPSFALPTLLRHTLSLPLLPLPVHGAVASLHFSTCLLLAGSCGLPPTMTLLHVCHSVLSRFLACALCPSLLVSVALLRTPLHPSLFVPAAASFHALYLPPTTSLLGVAIPPTLLFRRFPLLPLPTYLCLPLSPLISRFLLTALV